MKVMVIGGGGREHALCWKLKRSPSVSAVICAPGNPGIAREARCVNIGVEDLAGIINLAKIESADLIVIGPEVPLVAGLGNQLRSEGFAVFGPDKAAANLEGSKSFSKRLMYEAGVPTARFEVHVNCDEAIDTIRSWGAPIVIKASGLAAGKGVVVAQTEKEAIQAVKSMLAGNVFGEAGSQVVIEECLIGEEASCLFIVSGDTILPLASSQDHKALLDGDLGPNTGGMGAYSPAPCITDEVAEVVLETIARPIIAALKKKDAEFIGILYAGIMLTKDGPKTLEFNVRFGDPECQPLMSRLKSDLGELLLAAAERRLHDVKLAWEDGTALCVVVASDGYPNHFEKAQLIGGLDAIEAAGAIVFHAGTDEKDGAIVNKGGRVLGVTASASSAKEAQTIVYRALKKLDWPGGVYRHDIGHRAVTRENKQSTSI
ncbi:MAG: phosphoribosylamine--glycine ligase [Mariprofundus sp.]|nr:phosphoribosylamine--glycine ligase [Mariprofundus sp.]